MQIYTKSTSFNSDIHTPVELYMSLRNHYRKTCLLESNDYHSRSDSKSFIGLEPIIELKLENNQLTIISESTFKTIELNQYSSYSIQIQEVINSFQYEKELNSYITAYEIIFAIFLKPNLGKKPV